MSSTTKSQISRMVAKIKQLHNQGIPLNLTAAKRRFPDLVESAYAVTPFLGWRKLLIAAGIDYKDIEREYLNYVVCKICGKDFSILTGHLMGTHSMTPKEYRQKYPDAELMSETLRIAHRGMRQKPINLKITLPHWEELWTLEYLLDRIEDYRERGGPINFYSIHAHDRSTTDAAIRFFGSWDAAITRLGLNPGENRKQASRISLSDKEVINSLKDRQKNGLPLNENAIYTSDLRLYNAARRRFGSYRKALKAASIDPEKVYLINRYSDEELNKVIKAAYKINQLTGEARIKALKNLDKHYWPMVCARYKSWSKFAIKIGLNPDKFSFCEQEEDLIIAIKKLPSNMTAGRLFKENRSLYGKIWYRFGPVSIVLKKYHKINHVLRKRGKKL
ncbi:MAG: MucR family transcriptional regulator [Deltaproteobacteria bacterium]|nr:MucR family transcriptional regulator [Deltaproteobacteria bacterium]